MTKVLGYNLSMEMTALWLLESATCFGLGYAVLHAGIGGFSASQLPSSEIGGVAAVIAASVGLSSFVIGLYRPDTFLRLNRMLAKSAVGAVLCFPAIWLLGRIAGVDFGLLLGHGAWLPAKMLVAWLALVVSIRLAFSYSLRMNLFSRRVVIIGDGASALRTAGAIDRLGRGLFEVAGTMDGWDRPDLEFAGKIGPMMRHLRSRRVWGVVVTAATPDAQQVEAALRRDNAGIRVWNDRSFWEDQLRRVDIDQPDTDLGTAPGTDLGTGQAAESARAASGIAAVLRRASDIVLSLILLVVTLPVVTLTALAIRLTSDGPVLYRQERVGLHGKPFVLFKFRSMRTDAEALGPTWAAKADSRVTGVGAFIRRTRIDELPQLMNVLRGQMSFIGPRPERPHFVAKLAGIIPHYAARAAVKPGLTGWAQVNYPYGASVEDARMKLSFDLYYVRNHSFVLDVLILFATVRVILFQEGSR